jgi:hypothetical protein
VPQEVGQQEPIVELLMGLSEAMCPTVLGLMTDDDSDGMWEIVVPLAAGRYQYLFWIDEASWSLDPGNPEEVDGGPQGRSSEVLVVVRDGRLEVR